MIDINTFNLIEIIGWIGNIGFFVGAVWLARLNRLGWIAQALGNWMYIIYGTSKNSWSLIILDIVLLIVNTIGWWAWRKKQLKS